MIPERLVLRLGDADIAEQPALDGALRVAGGARRLLVDLRRCARRARCSSTGLPRSPARPCRCSSPAAWSGWRRPRSAGAAAAAAQARGGGRHSGRTRRGGRRFRRSTPSSTPRPPRRSACLWSSSRCRGPRTPPAGSPARGRAGACRWRARRARLCPRHREGGRAGRGGSSRCRCRCADVRRAMAASTGRRFGQ